MRIAVTGKGGCGKTTVAGALARHLARRGRAVVALDADPNPNLGVSLGVAREAVEAMQPVLNALLADGYTHQDPRPDPEDLLQRFGALAPGGVTLLATGKIERPTDACLCCGSHQTTRELFAALRADERVVVADLEAGLNDLLWARPGPDDLVLTVADTSAKAREIARRAVRLAEGMGVARIMGVANRVTAESDVDELSATLGVAVLGVPEDPAVATAEQMGVAPFDADPSSPAMVAVGRLAERLTAG